MTGFWWTIGALAVAWLVLNVGVWWVNRHHKGPGYE